MAYILRGDDDEGVGAQLHAAARTADLLTSLRLFSKGADPNFYHEVGNIYYESHLRYQEIGEILGLFFLGSLPTRLINK